MQLERMHSITTGVTSAQLLRLHHRSVILSPTCECMHARLNRVSRVKTAWARLRVCLPSSTDTQATQVHERGQGYCFNAIRKAAMYLHCYPKHCHIGRDVHTYCKRRNFLSFGSFCQSHCHDLSRSKYSLHAKSRFPPLLGKDRYLHLGSVNPRMRSSCCSPCHMSRRTPQ
jgi:hypothetical protein